jgi:hypothetical protein
MGSSIRSSYLYRHLAMCELVFHRPFPRCRFSESAYCQSNEDSDFTGITVQLWNLQEELRTMRMLLVLPWHNAVAEGEATAVALEKIGAVGKPRETFNECRWIQSSLMAPM